MGRADGWTVSCASDGIAPFLPSANCELHKYRNHHHRRRALTRCTNSLRAHCAGSKVSRELEDRFLKLREALGQRDEINQTLSLLTATLDSTADGILVTDSHGTIVRFNSTFAEL